jgi:hypothetical protein
MVSPLRRVPFVKRPECRPRQKDPKSLAPPFGPSLRLGGPSLRHCSVGPPQSVIHGRGRLSRHPCRDAHCATPALASGNEAGRARSKARAKQSQSRPGTCRSELARGKRLDNAFIQKGRVIVDDHRWQASSYRGTRTTGQRGRALARLALAFDFLATSRGYAEH